jgi:hypothetical protein
MILAHIMGIPLEESVLQLAPASAAMVTAVAIAGRANLRRLRRRPSSPVAPENMMVRRGRRFESARGP